MKILLTGGSGMVGKNILEHPTVSKFTILHPTRFELNLLSYDEVDNYIMIHKPDFVIHSAGLVGGIHANMTNPVDFMMENLTIGNNIVMASKNNNVKRLLNLASACMYPRESINKITEDQIMKGEPEPTNEGYAIAKIVVTKLCEYIRRMDKSFEYKTAIPCNLYGRHDKFTKENSHVIAAAIRKLHEADDLGLKSIDIWGDGTPRREFMYAGDLADFIFYAIEHFENMPQNINVGMGYDYSIDECYETIADIVKFDGVFIHDLTKPIGMKQRLMDNTRLKEFGWESKTQLKDGIIKTYDFYTEGMWMGE